MTSWICTGCTAAYAVGAPCCPQCQSTDHIEEGAEMPKITVDNGPSVADQEVVVDTDRGPELTPVAETDVDPQELAEERARERAAAERGEDVSAGSSSETSSEKEPTQPGKSTTGRQKPAPKTGSPSGKGQTGSSSAPGTDGGPTVPAPGPGNS